MQEEMESLKKNLTWEIVDKPSKARLVGCKWVFKRKDGIPGVEAPRLKARLVAKGFTQKEGIDFNEIYSPVVKHRSIRIILSLVANFNLELEQLDVKTAFLHGSLDETIYMRQPEGFNVGDSDKKVCLLKKSLYDLKQSPRQWYRKFDEFMMNCNFKRSSYDWCIYYKLLESGSLIYLLLYVDDMLIASKDLMAINDLKHQLNTNFEMKDLGAAKRILGMQIQRHRKAGTLFLCQSDYLGKVLERFDMQNAKSVSIPVASHFKVSKDQEPQDDQERDQMKNVPYSNAVGCLIYAMVCTRPDIAHGVSLVCRHMANPGRSHWQVVKWLLRYIKGTLDRGLLFGGDQLTSEIVEGFVDSDYAGSVDTRKSQTGLVFMVFGTAVSWKANLQKVVALSTTEAEFMAITEAVKEALWLKGIMAELGHGQECVKVHSDSQGAIHLSKHQVFHERSKHIDVRMHFVREVAETGEVKLVKVNTNDNPADMLTKSVPSNKFEHCLKLIRLDKHG
ncbi:unnamed protein product [Rhodiola kirilowii]